MKATKSSFNVVLIGAGNLGWNLAHIFHDKGVRISCIISRSINSARSLAAEINTHYAVDLRDIPSEADFVIVTVSDPAIQDVISAMPDTDNVVLHTSGSIGLSIFGNKFLHHGVLYPFQTFTKNIRINNYDFPLCIEASDSGTEDKIRCLASLIGNNIIRLDSEKRRILHLSGVLANNFSNYLITRAMDLMKAHDIDAGLLLPLLNETIRKLESATPEIAQTGPARRNSRNIIDKHLEMLHDDPSLKNLYSFLTDSIIAYYSK